MRSKVSQHGGRRTLLEAGRSLNNNLSVRGGLFPFDCQPGWSLTSQNNAGYHIGTSWYNAVAEDPTIAGHAKFEWVELKAPFLQTCLEVLGVV